MAPKKAVCKVWNQTLVRALEEKQRETLGQNNWFYWKEAADTVRKENREIKLSANQASIMGLPKSLKQKALRFCEEIIRGARDFPDAPVPRAEAAQAGGPDSAAEPVLPYLHKIQFRGGGYAILRAMMERDHGQAEMTKDEILVRAQRHCNVEMRPDFHRGQPKGVGWDSIQTLERYKLVRRQPLSKGNVKGGRSQKDLFTLTTEGFAFVHMMMQRFHPEGVNAEDSGAFSSSGPKVRVQPAVARREPLSAKQAAAEAELWDWAVSAPIGAVKDFDVSKASRQLLHQVCDEISAEASGWRLEHVSDGDGRARTLRVMKVGAAQAAASSASSTPVRKAARLSGASDAPSSGRTSTPGFGRRVSGGSSVGSQEERRRLAAEAAERRASQTPGCTRPPPSQEQRSSAASSASAASPILLIDEEEDSGPPSAKRKRQRASEDSEPGNGLQLYVDFKERKSDNAPRAMLEQIEAAHQDLAVVVERKKLLVGDFTWLRAGSEVVAAVERKTIKDLVSRSNQAAHLRQLAKLQASEILLGALLIEGEERTAARCFRTGDTAPSPAAFGLAGDIWEQADVLTLYAALILRSELAIVRCADEQDTVRTLAAWSEVLQLLAQDERGLSSHARWSGLGKKLDEKSAELGRELEDLLIGAGVPLRAAMWTKGYFPSIEALAAKLQRHENCESAEVCLQKMLQDALVATKSDSPEEVAHRAAQSLAGALVGAGSSTGLTGASQPWRLVLEANKPLVDGNEQLPSGSAIASKVLDDGFGASAIPGRLRALVYFEHRGPESSTCFDVVPGAALVDLLQNYVELDSSDGICAIHLARILVDLCPPAPGVGRRVFLIENVPKAVKDATQGGAEHPSFRIGERLRGIAAGLAPVLALRHNILSLHSTNRSFSRELLGALLKLLSAEPHWC